MWVAEHRGANEAAARQHASVYWNGPTEERDVEQQVFLVDRAIRNRDLGLVLSPSNPFALNTAVQKSLATGMSVVIVGNPLSLRPEKRLSFVLNDEQEAGGLAAQRIEASLHRRGEILIVGIDPLSPGTPERAIAFEEAIRRDAPAMHVDDRLQGFSSFGQAELATERAILANPHLSAILALNTTATSGAIAAVRTTHTSDRIVIVGCDYNFDLLFLLRRKMLDALVAQNMRKMGNIAVDSVIAEQQGVPVAPYSLVKPVLITRENIDDEPIQQMLNMDWRTRP